ncbi:MULTISPECIES: SDR family oxidoreductase [unclassified Micromonospora]|uniref:SDR family oxidoreductase n=1 Tax=unclassified Micromonospora TaxID=2617518 RepID=UPI00331DC6B7
MSRSVLVTGGNRGIGLAAARRLAARGDRVAVTYRAGEPPEGLFGVRCDVTDAEQVGAAVSEVEREQGPVEIMVHSAGMTRDRLLFSMPEEDFRAPLETNLIGAYRLTRLVLRGMLRRRWGRLVFVSSVVALRGEAGQANYAASKAALIGFARSVAREVGTKGITANVVTPGPVDTDMLAVLSEERRTELARTPVGRLGRPEEVAAAIAFLTGEDAGFVTGVVLPVDGGAGMGA